MIRINQQDLQMKVDTEASVSLVSEMTWKKLHGVDRGSSLTHTNVKLHAYTGEDIPMLGQAMVVIQRGNQTAQFPMLVMAVNGPSLLGQVRLAQL